MAAPLSAAPPHDPATSEKGLYVSFALLAAVGRSARRGIVIKGGRYLEALAKVDTLVIDKTGTLTIGRPEVTEPGLRQIASYRKRESSVAVWFLGDPIRLPRPLRKIGRRIPPGFSMTLESILSSEPGTFRC